MADTTPDTSKPASAWEEWITRTTAVLAVLAALSSGTWGASNLHAILEQGKVNDAWAYYQAKSIKGHDAEQARDLIKTLSVGQPSERAREVALLESKYAEEARQENKAKEDVLNQAHGYEKERDKMVERGFWFEISFAALQVGVILGTIATAKRSRGLWFTAIALGVIGILLFLNGFHPVIKVDKSLYEGTSQGMSYAPDSGSPSK